VLNPLAFSNVPNGQFANNQGALRGFRGFRVPGENANFGRNFRFKERVNLNVRVEFSNIFNRMVLPAPTVVAALGAPPLSFSAKPTVFTSGPNTGLLSSGFGVVNPTAGTTGQRQGSFVARIQF
jgi:hypothetical protein